MGPDGSAGFWGRVEAWLLALQRDRERAARWLQVAYWISMAFVLLGFVLILDALLRKGLL